MYKKKVGTKDYFYTSIRNEKGKVRTVYLGSNKKVAVKKAKDMSLDHRMVNGFGKLDSSALLKSMYAFLVVFLIFFVILEMRNLDLVGFVVDEGSVVVDEEVAGDIEEITEEISEEEIIEEEDSGGGEEVVDSVPIVENGTGEEEVNETVEIELNETGVNESEEEVLNETVELNETDDGVLVNNTINETEINVSLNISDENLSLNLTDVGLTNVTLLNISNSSTSNITDSYSNVSINKPVKWKKRVKLSEETSNLTIELDSSAENVSLVEIENGEEISLDLDNVYMNDSGVERPIESTNLVTGSAIINFNAVYYDFIVFFKGMFNNVITGFAVLEAGEDSVEIILDELVEEVEVEYYLPGPTAIEINLSESRKQIIVSSDIHYENILTYTEIQDVSLETIKLYWITDGERVDQEFVSYDVNDNGLIDYIEWITPSLSNQTYELLIINITEAIHLDENRTFIEDVFDFVNVKDDNYTLIPAGDYLRVTFEQFLDNTKDITIYARKSFDNTSNESAEIEVYRVNDNVSIATFTGILDESWHKVYLTNLNGSDDTFDLRVFDADVEFDYVVDPTEGISQINQSNSFVIYDVDDVAGDGFGHSVSTGDFNNDGYDDALIGAYLANGGASSTGKSYIYFGAESNMADGTNANVTLLDPDDVEDDGFGESVSTGDFNNDGYDDALIGASMANGGASSTGKSYIYFGAESNMADGTNANVTLLDPDDVEDDGFGESVSTGDFNNDGYDDALVGANDAGVGGEAYIYFGAESNMADGTNANVTLLDPDDVASDGFGHSVSTGDFNNDGYDDALIGAYLANGGASSTGKSYIYFGAESNMADGTNANVTLLDPDDVEDDGFGESVSTGDFNNDGYDDALVGASEANGGASGTGKAYIYFGAESNIADGTNANVTLLDPDDVEDDGFGESVSTGDFNNDGYDDALVGASEANGGASGTGKSYIYFIGNSFYDYSPKLLNNGTSSTTLEIYTYLNSICKYGTSSGTGYGDMTALTTTDGLNHTLDVSGLSDGDVNFYYVKCNNNVYSNESDEMTIKFGVAEIENNYNINNSVQWACEKTGTTTKPTNNTDCISYATAGDYKNLQTDNGNRWVTSGADIENNVESHIFTFNISTSSTRAKFYWQGYGFVSGQPPDTFGTFISVWNFNENIWEFKDSKMFTSAADDEFIMELTDLTNYLNSSGQISLLVHHKIYHNNSLNTDWVYLMSTTSSFPEAPLNTLPTTPTPSLVSFDGTNFSSANLNCSATINDDDGDAMNVSVRWYNNSILWLSEDFNNTYSSGTLFNSTLGSGNLSVGENWTCSMRFSDGTNSSGWGTSNNLTILPVNLCGANLTTSTNLTSNVTCMGSGLYIGADDVVLDCKGYTVTYSTGSDASSGILAEGYSGLIIKNCNVEYGAVAGAKYSISLTDINDSALENNTFVGGSLSVFMDSSSNVTIKNNTLNSTLGTTVYFYKNSDNNLLLENYFIGSSSDGVRLQSFDDEYPENNKISGNTFSNIDGYELNIVSEGINGTNITNQDITDYSFSGDGSLLSFGNSGEKGLIEFLEPITGNGTNLSEDIQIGPNLISVYSSSKPGLNKRATLTFYNVSVSGTPTIVKDGGWCDDGECTGFNSNGDTHSFTVDSFSNYSVGNLSCGDSINSGITLGAGMACDDTAVIFNASNVGIDCNGYDINFSNKNAGYGIVDFVGHSNLTIRNCVIRSGSSNLNYYSAIFLSGTDEGYIYNNTVDVPGSGAGGRIWGVYLNGTSNISILKNNLTAGEDTLLVSSIYAKNSSDSIIKNNIINNTGAGYNGISLYDAGDQYSIYSTIESNTIEVASTSSYGIRGGNNTNITNNEITSGYYGLFSGVNSNILNNTIFSDDTGIKVGSGCVIESNLVVSLDSGALVIETGNYNNISHNIINSSGTEGSGIYFSTSNYNKIVGNNITTINCNPTASQRYRNCHAIKFVESKVNQILNNTFNVRGSESDVFYFYQWSYNNSISNNNITYAQADVISMGDSSVSLMNNFTNNTFNNVQGLDLNISGEGANYTYFIDQPIAGYHIDSGIVYFKDTEFGELKYLEAISGTGTNLSSDIIIGNNSIFVNSSNSGLNKSANLTFYNLSWIGETAFAKKDGVSCSSDKTCGNITNISNTYFFNVTGFSNYSVDELCDKVLTADYTLTSDIACPSTALNIGSNDIILDCAGYSINYSYNGADAGYGVNNSGGYDNIIVKGCNIVEGSPSTNSKYAIYFLDAGNGSIENNTITTSGIFGRGVHFDSSSNSSVINNTISTTGTSGYGLFFSSSSDNIAKNNTITTIGLTSVGVHFDSSSNLTVENNIITTTGNIIPTLYTSGIHFYESSNSSAINNTITTTGNGGYGLSFSSSSDNIAANNTINTSSGTVDSFYIYSMSLGNLFQNNNIIQSGRDGIRLHSFSGSFPENNNFTNNSFLSVTGYDLNIVDAGIDETYLINQPISSYNFAGAGSKVYFKDNEFGELKYLEAISGTGTNLSSDIKIEDNIIGVNSSGHSGLNKSANLSFFGVGGFDEIFALRDGLDCPSDICGNITNISNIIYSFNVTGFSNYSIGTLTYPEPPGLSYGERENISDQSIKVPKCSVNSDCDPFYERCVDGECVSLLNVNLLRIDSPVKPGSILNFAYSIESSYGLSGNMEVRYWIEKSGVSLSPEINTVCGNNVKEGFETCDFGDKNTNELCVPEYGKSCTYCDFDCELRTVFGESCGDEVCQELENTYNCQEDCGDGNYLNRVFYFVLDFFEFTGFASVEVEGQNIVYLEEGKELIDLGSIYIPSDLIGEYELHVQVENDGYIVEIVELFEVSHYAPIVIDALVGSLENLNSPVEFDLSLFSNIDEEVSVRVYEEIVSEGGVVWSQIRDVSVNGKLVVGTVVDQLDAGEYDYNLKLYFSDEIYETSSSLSVVDGLKDIVYSKFFDPIRSIF